MAWQIESITHDCSLSSAFISLYSELYSDLEGLFLTKLQLFGRVNAYSPLCWQQGPSSRELSYRHTSKIVAALTAAQSCLILDVHHALSGHQADPDGDITRARRGCR